MRRPLDNIIRMPRERDTRPSIRLRENLRRPRRLLGNIDHPGGGIRAPDDDWGRAAYPSCSLGCPAMPRRLEQAYFTAISAVTVTGHTVVSTPEYWSAFGHVVIFLLMMVGGLGFMVISTFLLVIMGDRTTIQQRALTRGLMSDAAGVETDAGDPVIWQPGDGDSAGDLPAGVDDIPDADHGAGGPRCFDRPGPSTSSG